MEKDVLISKEEAKDLAYLEMVKHIDKVSDAPIMSVNPFLSNFDNNFVIERKVLHTDRMMASVNIMDKDTGEIISSADQNKVFSKRKYVDRGQFVKVYFNRLKDMFNLTGTSLKVFGYILNEVQKSYNKDRDMIYLNVTDCMEFCNWKTRNMVYTGILELLMNGFIARAANPPSHYYIDPKIVFNGNRIVIWEEYVKKENDYFYNKEITD